ncbi:ScbA/BarX family gamma-butyrolactone biosynthesis protein [Kitasatospora herbaricolor]|uniref:A-factor biosynthesis hotdog domain-containing protein n=1 Tax=Kitasatospora herbaricolor TaxID=68217 RepID=A0ABZ1W035_9ACTN|nr:ScbA/BarX family gamma-butyrolactone biosynthesis protein [Kitasatospora herbaricolor]
MLQSAVTVIPAQRRAGVVPAVSRAAGEVAGLSFQQSIPRELVHRASVAEVFLTDAVELGEGRFLVAAQWPRDHAMYHPDAAGLSDPMLFAETIRQALVFLAHRYHAVPLTHRFIGCDMDFEITDPQALRVGGAPASVVLEVRWGARSPQRHGMRVEVQLVVGGRRCGRGSLRVIAVDGKRYAMLRGRAAAAAAGGVRRPVVDRRAAWRMPAAAVGRLRAKDSVLVRVAGGWELALDLDHAILFDHPSDHVPLMAMLEGFRQLGHHLLTTPDGRTTPDAGTVSDPGAAADAGAVPDRGTAADTAAPSGAGAVSDGRTASDASAASDVRAVSDGGAAVDGRTGADADAGAVSGPGAAADAGAGVGRAAFDGGAAVDGRTGADAGTVSGPGADVDGTAVGGCNACGGGCGVGVVPVLLSLSTVCLAFGELDRPVRLVVREDCVGVRGVRRLSIDAVQGGTTLATSSSVWAVSGGVGHGVGEGCGVSASQMACTLVDIPERWRVGAV